MLGRVLGGETGGGGGDVVRVDLRETYLVDTLHPIPLAKVSDGSEDRTGGV